MDKIYDEWNELKKKLSKEEKEIPFFHERELWWAITGMNVGVEMIGKGNLFQRPILILKVFGKDSLWAIPLTSKDKIGIHHYQFQHGLQRNSIELSQLRCISSKRLLNKIGKLSPEEFNQIKALIKAYL